MNLYFGYCPNLGFETFESEDKAKEYAQSSIDHFRDEAGDGWSEYVDVVCWGEVKEQAAITEDLTTEQAKAKGIYIPAGFDGFREYALKG